MAIALQSSRATSETVAALCWGRIGAISATLMFDVMLVWGVARLFA